MLEPAPRWKDNVVASAIAFVTVDRALTNDKELYDSWVHFRKALAIAVDEYLAEQECNAR